MKAGSRPIRIRPSNVAAPVAMTTGRKVRLDTFEREQNAAERRVEGRRDARPGACGEERHFLPVREPDRLGEGRTQRRADLNDRALASDRRSAADRQGRGQGLDDGDLPADVAAAVEDRIHHLGHAVSLGLGREPLHQKDHDQTADDRREKQKIAETARSLENIGVVREGERAVIESVVNEPDRRAQRRGPDAGHDADEQREQAQNEQTDPSLLSSRRSGVDEARSIVCVQEMRYGVRHDVRSRQNVATTP